MTIKEKADIVEFMLWLSGRLHIELDYMSLLKEFEDSKKMCLTMCNYKEK